MIHSQKLLLGSNHRNVIILGFCLILTSCAAKVASFVTPDVGFDEFKTFYVVRSDADDREVYKSIQQEIEKMGRQTSSGPRSSTPSDVDVIVTYHSYWIWDFGWFLKDLLIQIRDPKTNVLLASAHLIQSTVPRKEPHLIAREGLNSILK